MQYVCDLWQLLEQARENGVVNKKVFNLMHLKIKDIWLIVKIKDIRLIVAIGDFHKGCFLQNTLLESSSDY